MTPILFEIIRRVDDTGVWGMLVYRPSGVPICCTLERAYNSVDGWSPKIKDGLWHCSKSKYFKGGYDTYEIHIPGHSRILFHKGNWPEDSEGCVLLGESFSVLRDKEALSDSKGAFNEFMEKCSGEDHFFVKVTTA